jgi:hypothetical protein
VDGPEIIRCLRRHPLALALVLACSLVAAVLGGHDVVLGMPPHLRARALETGIANKQLVLDSPQSQISTLRSDTDALTLRSGTVAQVLTSHVLLQDIARRMKIPYDELTAEGPAANAAASIYNVVTPSEARGNQVVAEHRPYRLTVFTQIGLPIVTISTQGPTPAEAARLADTANLALQAYLKRLRAGAAVPPHFDFVVRDVGAATAGSVGGGAAKASPVLAATTVSILGVLGIIALSALRGRLSPFPRPRRRLGLRMLRRAT